MKNMKELCFVAAGGGGGAATRTPPAESDSPAAEAPDSLPRPSGLRARTPSLRSEGPRGPRRPVAGSRVAAAAAARPPGAARAPGAAGGGGWRWRPAMAGHAVAAWHASHWPWQHWPGTGPGSGGRVEAVGSRAVEAPDRGSRRLRGCLSAGVAQSARQPRGAQGLTGDGGRLGQRAPLVGAAVPWDQWDQRVALGKSVIGGHEK
jgi:hypothetical protein